MMKFLQILTYFLLASIIISCTDEGIDRKSAVKKIVMNSRHSGAHGMGYNLSSLEELSKKLNADDIPLLLELYKNRSTKSDDSLDAIAVSFALASQCDLGLIAVIKAREDQIFDEADYRDVLNFIGASIICSKETRKDASDLAQKIK